MREQDKFGASPAQSRFLAFFDECGDHSLVKVDPDFPLFVLALVVVERAAYRDTILPEVSPCTLRRRHPDGSSLYSRDIRAVKVMLHNLPFTLFIAAIHKPEHLARLLAGDNDSYGLPLRLTMDRLLHFLEFHGEVRLPIVCRLQEQAEARPMAASFHNVLSTGGIISSAEQFEKLDCRLILQPSIDDLPGLQITNLCAHGCGQHIVKPNEPNPLYEAVRGKVYQNSGVSGWEEAFKELALQKPAFSRCRSGVGR